MYKTKCPCGNGTIIEYIDRTQGFREHVATICCDNCSKKYVLMREGQKHFFPVLRRFYEKSSRIL